MRGYIIDPIERKVTGIDHDTFNLHAMYACLTIKDIIRPVFDINSVRLTDRDYIWCDGEGCLVENVPVFRIKGYPGIIPGRGLVLGIDRTGANQTARIAIGSVRDMVVWTDFYTTGELGETREEERDGVTHIIVGEPILYPKTDA